MNRHGEEKNKIKCKSSTTDVIKFVHCEQYVISTFESLPFTEARQKAWSSKGTQKEILINILKTQLLS